MRICPIHEILVRKISMHHWPEVYLVLDHVIVKARKYGIANASAM